MLDPTFRLQLYHPYHFPEIKEVDVASRFVQLCFLANWFPAGDGPLVEVGQIE